MEKFPKQYERIEKKKRHKKITEMNRIRQKIREENSKQENSKEEKRREQKRRESPARMA